MKQQSHSKKNLYDIPQRRALRSNSVDLGNVSMGALEGDAAMHGADDAAAGGSGNVGKAGIVLGPDGNAIGHNDGAVPLSKSARKAADKSHLHVDIACACCHVPYPHNHAPFANMRLVPCQSCRKKWVPEILMATVEPPATLVTAGRGRLIQAQVCRALPPKQKGEALAMSVSDTLPFLQHDLMRQLLTKLRLQVSPIRDQCVCLFACPGHCSLTLNFPPSVCVCVFAGHERGL